MNSILDGGTFASTCRPMRNLTAADTRGYEQVLADRKRELWRADLQRKNPCAYCSTTHSDANCPNCGAPGSVR